MKKSILAIMITGMVCLNSGAMANTAKVTKPADAVAVATSPKEVVPQSFAGLVKESSDGLFLETAKGIFRLEGIDLEKYVGKKVAILGIIANEGESEHIIVAKATVAQ